MLQLTDVQGRILNAFVEYDGDNKGKIGYGLTSGKLGKLGINRQTFDNPDHKTINNKDFLLENYFLRITRIEPHGKQDWIFYKITTLGVIAYLKWAFNSKSLPDVTFTETFFPLITRYIKKLHEIYDGDTFSNILSNTALKIDVTPQVTGFYKNKRIDSHSMVCSMKLRMEDFDIIYNQFLEEPVIEKIPRVVDTDYGDKRNNELNSKLSECFTFLFYYNLINSGISSNEIMNLFIQETGYLDIKNEEYSLDEKEIKTKFKKHFIKLDKNSKYILNLIKSDPELRQLNSKNFDEILNRLKQTSVIKDIRKKL